MITTNGAKIIGFSKINNTNTTSLVKTDNTTIEYLTSSAANYAFRRCSCNNLANIVESAADCAMVMNIGVGDTTPTASDYWLDDTSVGGTDVNTIIECRGSSIWTPTILDNGNLAYTFEFHNTSNNTIAIKELGLSFLCTAGKFLVGRKVIEPYYVIPNEVFLLTYGLEFS